MPELTLYHPEPHAPTLPGATAHTTTPLRGQFRSWYHLENEQERAALIAARSQNHQGFVPLQDITLSTPSVSGNPRALTATLEELGLHRIARQIHWWRSNRRPVLGIKITLEERRAVLAHQVAELLPGAKFYFMPGPVRLCERSIAPALSAWERGELRDTDFVPQRRLYRHMELLPGTRVPSGLGLGEALPETGDGPPMTQAQRRWAERYLQVRYVQPVNREAGRAYLDYLQNAQPQIRHLGEDPNAVALFMIRAYGSGSVSSDNRNETLAHHIASLITDPAAGVTLLRSPLGRTQSSALAGMVRRLTLQREALPVALRTGNSALLSESLRSPVGQAILTYADRQASQAQL